MCGKRLVVELVKDITKSMTVDLKGSFFSGEISTTDPLTVSFAHNGRDAKKPAPAWRRAGSGATAITTVIF